MPHNPKSPESQPSDACTDIVRNDNADQISQKYKDAGVDIDAGNLLIEHIKPAIRKTNRPGVMSAIGGFGGLFELPWQDYKSPVLVSGTDGVGTKLKLAIETNIHSSIGIDLVAMCVNDIIVTGADPLFFLDYLATSKLDVEKSTTIIDGIAEGCVQAGAALIGGETAEMPGMYANDDYDLAGFAVGLVEKTDIIDGSQVCPGDAIIGLASSGPHANGFSLIHSVLRHSGADIHANFNNEKRTLAEVLLTPTRIYVKSIQHVLKNGPKLKALAHITGGGLIDNIPRVLPDNVAAEIFQNQWTRPAIFGWLQRNGNISDDEMHRVFNCGIGMVVLVANEDLPSALDAFSHAGESAWHIGNIIKANDLGTKSGAGFVHRPPKIAVLISGRGSNLQALINATTNHKKHSPPPNGADSIIDANICLVISNEPGVPGLALAASHAIPTLSVTHRDFDDRYSFDCALDQMLRENHIDIVLLAGFMRILGREFVERWLGRLLNIHPSLLPLYPGLNTHARALAAADSQAGASVHFVTPQLDGGPVIIQGKVDVNTIDNEDTLATRVLKLEHVIYPIALRWLVSGRASLEHELYHLDGVIQTQPPVWYQGQLTYPSNRK